MTLIEVGERKLCLFFASEDGGGEGTILNLVLTSSLLQA